jgi:hypothetical protein
LPRRLVGAGPVEMRPDRWGRAESRRHSRRAPRRAVQPHGRTCPFSAPIPTSRGTIVDRVAVRPLFLALQAPTAIQGRQSLRPTLGYPPEMASRKGERGGKSGGKRGKRRGKRGHTMPALVAATPLRMLAPPSQVRRPLLVPGGCETMRDSCVSEKWVGRSGVETGDSTPDADTFSSPQGVNPQPKAGPIGSTSRSRRDIASRGPTLQARQTRQPVSASRSPGLPHACKPPGLAGCAGG